MPRTVESETMCPIQKGQLPLNSSQFVKKRVAEILYFIVTISLFKKKSQQQFKILGQILPMCSHFVISLTSHGNYHCYHCWYNSLLVLSPQQNRSPVWTGAVLSSCSLLQLNTQLGIESLFSDIC